MAVSKRPQWPREASFEICLFSHENFVAKTMDFIEEHSGEHWVSLSVSEFLSIGRIYADATLHKLVSFMLTSYLTQVKVYVSMYSAWLYCHSQV